MLLQVYANSHSNKTHTDVICNPYECYLNITKFSDHTIEQQIKKIYIKTIMKFIVLLQFG